MNMSFRMTDNSVTCRGIRYLVNSRDWGLNIKILFTLIFLSEMIADYDWPTNVYKMAFPYLGLNHTVDGIRNLNNTPSYSGGSDYPMTIESL